MASLQRTISRAITVKGLNKKQEGEAPRNTRMI